ncbi:zf-DHHC-domain-containing protein [Dacryopinax primogenitus]|uniref:Palmitoyltransferase n=1 Tax=Dacryopinax primogenitus (strain DJM 731) TaxID=1858805 RepID=M5GCT3_DACPD|nr:zf-DHHC-domain-containing protein [Dacryopinax primogenitus]EJU06410.1 zf-DHHC-domain-containing protein [Dacryopinax primogenitus]
MSLRSASKLVFRCFKSMEKAGDWLTGAAGPVFISFAWVLMSGGAVVFFGTIAPRLPFIILTLPICILIAANLFGHYYLACTVSPGYADSRTAPVPGWGWAPKRSKPLRLGKGWGNGRLGDRLLRSRSRERRCKKCGGMRPERAHHCRICKKDVLKYDHHCPLGINQCVGLGNERHFVLFMAYFVLACFCFCSLGYSYVWLSLNYFELWPYFPGRVAFILIYILAGVLSLAVLTMLLWQLRLISVGETTVENYDNDAYRRMTRSRGEPFVNCFDLGWRRNLWLFFNLDEYPIYALMLPLRVMPYTAGHTWAKRPGYERHGGVDDGDEMTDEEDY